MPASTPDRDHALAQYRQAVAARPHDAAAEFALGTALWPAGHRDEAIEHLARAVALDDQHVDARNNLGNALLELGRFDEAIAQYARAYADVNDRDYEALVRAVRVGRIKVRTGL